MEMEDKFEELKIKYNNGEFLENNRKENEIEILRREKFKFKTWISKLKEDLKISDTKRKKDEDIISELKYEIVKN